MKIGSALALLLLVGSASVRSEYIPTPASAISFAINKDSRKWTPQHQAGNSTRIILEMVPRGDSIEKWKELVAVQIDFARAPLRLFVDTWKGLLVKADPKVELKEEIANDGSIVLTYKSPAANEFSQRRFMKGSDAVYMLAYHVRPKLKNEARFKTWSGIIASAGLVPNPQKRK